MTREQKIEQAKQEINECRENYNREHKLKQGSKGYLPAVKDFITAEWNTGFYVISMDDFKKMPKAARNKILDVGIKG